MTSRRGGLSVVEAAELTGLSVSTIQRMVDDGRLKGWRIPARRGQGEERRVDPADARRLQAELQGGSPPVA